MRITKREFRGEEIVLDFNAFVQCTFVDCTIVFHGYSEPIIENCNFPDCSFQYRGPAGIGLAWLAAQKNSDAPGNQLIADSLLRAAGLPA